jgi:hypothetical protein
MAFTRGPALAEVGDPHPMQMRLPGLSAPGSPSVRCNQTVSIEEGAWSIDASGAPG